jgi:diguanylate cyclase (GGDEF)-like protein
LCQTLGFQASTLWEVDEGKEHLRCRLAHVEPGFGLEKFARKSRSLVLRAGEGLPGRSWESGQVVWLRDIADDKSIPRRDVAREAGLHTAIVVPLLSQGSIIGMLDVFCLQPQEHNDETALTLTTIASHLAHCRERAAQERDISRLGRIQRLLSEVNAAVIRIRDRHKLYREVCRIALEVGGFGTVWIAQFDRHGKRLRVGASAGPVDVGSSLQAALEYLGNPVNSALATREIQAINDLALGGLADQPVCHELLAAGLRSLVVIPLISERVVVGIVGLGAAEPDYFHAGELSLTKELVASLGFAVEFITNERRLVRQAFYDPLTGLPNRSLFVERLERLLQAAARSGGSVAVALADLRHFRHINEVFGRRTGDGVLKCIADRLREVWPDRAHLCRVGGDRFAGMVVGHSDAHALIDGVLDPVTRALREPIVIDDHDLTVNITAGVASFPADGDDAETLMRRAEAAMLHARRKGERLRFFHVDSVADTSRVLNLEIRLRVALEQEQFILHYQPVVSIPDRDVVGLEALIRWNEPEKGLVPPAEFIPVLEETGLIVSVGRWIVRQAMIDCVQWRADGYHPPRVAINASAVELHHQKFVSTVERALRGFRRSGGSLAIELTESVLMHDMRDTIRKLEALRDLGVGISIDDFGTGYSSLGYLARLPVSSLKIDRSFILDLATSPQSMTMVSTIISLGHSLGLKVIAEGVETEEQFRLLHLLRCDYAQGYLISRPVPAEEVPAMLTEAE